MIMPFLSRRLQYVDACLVMELAVSVYLIFTCLCLAGISHSAQDADDSVWIWKQFFTLK